MRSVGADAAHLHGPLLARDRRDMAIGRHRAPNQRRQALPWLLRGGRHTAHQRRHGAAQTAPLAGEAARTGYGPGRAAAAMGGGCGRVAKGGTPSPPCILRRDDDRHTAAPTKQGGPAERPTKAGRPQHTRAAPMMARGGGTATGQRAARAPIGPPPADKAAAHIADINAAPAARRVPPQRTAAGDEPQPGAGRTLRYRAAQDGRRQAAASCPMRGIPQLRGCATGAQQGAQHSRARQGRAEKNRRRPRPTRPRTS